MRTKFKAWAKPYLDEHKELVPNLEALISSNKNICLEIGCGKGLFLISMATKNKDKVFIGIEKNETCAGYTAKKIVENKIDNAYLIAFDIEKYFLLFPASSIEAIYLNFSDPWPKKRHHKRRLTGDKFINFYKSILKENGKIYQKTDNRELFDFSIENFINNGFKIEEIDYDYKIDENSDCLSEYEKSFREENKTIYRLVATK